MDMAEISKSIDRELARIGLNQLEAPYGLAGTVEGLREFVELLRALPVGATWRDVHPDIPAHWVLDDDSTWTHAFRPYGDWDYQSPPAGSSIVVSFGEAQAHDRFQALVGRAKAAGFPIYGSGIEPRHSEESQVTSGYIVLPIGTAQSIQFELADWAREQPDVIISRCDRNEDDVYFEGVDDGK